LVSEVLINRIRTELNTRTENGHRNYPDINARHGHLLGRLPNGSLKEHPREHMWGGLQLLPFDAFRQGF